MLIESKATYTLKDFLSDDLVKPVVKNSKEINFSPIYKQKLTHQLITFLFLHIAIEEEHPFDGFEWVNKKQLQQLSFPRTIRTYFIDNLLSLNLYSEKMK